MSETVNTSAEAPQIDPTTASDADFSAALDQIEGTSEPELPSEPAETAPAAPKMVPLSALHEARAETRKEREERLRSEAVMNDRLSKIQEQLAARDKPEPPAIPEFEADPAANLDHRMRRYEEWLAAQERHAQAQAQVAQFQATYKAAASQFTAEAPDFQEAYAHAVKHMQALQQVTGIPADRMEQEIALSAMRSGRNPAQAVYEFAKTAGYAPKAAEPDLSAQQRGQAATRTVGQGGAPGGAVNASAQSLLRADLKTIGAMSDADFEKVLAAIR